jgi:hypothetical protein
MGTQGASFQRRGGSFPQSDRHLCERTERCSGKLTDNYITLFSLSCRRRGTAAGCTKINLLDMKNAINSAEICNSMLLEIRSAVPHFTPASNIGEGFMK